MNPISQNLNNEQGKQNENHTKTHHNHNSEKSKVKRIF